MIAPPASPSSVFRGPPAASAFHSYGGPGAASAWAAQAQASTRGARGAAFFGAPPPPLAPPPPVHISSSLDLGAMAHDE
jgi:hypothetical protein